MFSCCINISITLFGTDISGLTVAHPLPGFCHFWSDRCGLGLATPIQPDAPSARRLNRGLPPPEWVPGPTRAPPGGEGPRPPLSRSASAWQRLRRLAAPPSTGGGRRWAGPQASGFPTPPGLRPVGVAAPSHSLLRPCLATPSPPGGAFDRERGAAPGQTPRELAPGPTRAPAGGEGLRPPLSRSASAWRRLCRLAAPSSAGGDRRWAGPHASGFPARPGLRPVKRGCALPYVARLRTSDPLAAWRAFERAESGQDPTRVGFRPDPGFDSWGGATASPAFGARLGPMPSPTLRPTPRTLATRSSPRLGTGPGPGPRPCSIVRPSVMLLYAASVPGPRLTPPPPSGSPGLGRASFSATRLQPALPTGGPADSSRVHRPSVRTLLDRAVSPGSALFFPYAPRGTALDQSLAQRSCVRFASQPAKPTLLDPAAVLTPAGPSPPIRTDSPRRLSATRRPRLPARSYPPGRGDTVRSAVGGRAGLFDFGKKVSVLP